MNAAALGVPVRRLSVLTAAAYDVGAVVDAMDPSQKVYRKSTDVGKYNISFLRKEAIPASGGLSVGLFEISFEKEAAYLDAIGCSEGLFVKVKGQKDKCEFHIRAKAAFGSPSDGFIFTFPTVYDTLTNRPVPVYVLYDALHKGCFVAGSYSFLPGTVANTNPLGSGNVHEDITVFQVDAAFVEGHGRTSYESIVTEPMMRTDRDGNSVPIMRKGANGEMVPATIQRKNLHSIADPPPAIVVHDSRGYAHHRRITKFYRDGIAFCPWCWGPQHHGGTCIYKHRCRLCGETIGSGGYRRHACNYGHMEYPNTVPFTAEMAPAANVTAEQSERRKRAASTLAEKMAAAKAQIGQLPRDI